MERGMAAHPGYLTHARFAIVGTVIAGFLLGLALAMSPQLHKLVHPDGDQPFHSCLATTLQAGAYDTVDVVAVAIQLVATSVATVPPRDGGMVESFFLSCRLLEHGPPRVLLS
jgi:hypothetical protein